jgi:hypothetical protein
MKKLKELINNLRDSVSEAYPEPSRELDYLSEIDELIENIPEVVKPIRWPGGYRDRIDDLRNTENKIWSAYGLVTFLLYVFIFFDREIEILITSIFSLSILFVIVIYKKIRWSLEEDLNNLLKNCPVPRQ